MKGSIPYVIDIHAHPEHLTAMPYFKRRYGARTVTGSRIGIVLRAFRNIYNQIMYNKILVPLDGSKLAEAVLPYAAFLASALQLPVDLPHVDDRETVASPPTRCRAPVTSSTWPPRSRHP